MKKIVAFSLIAIAALPLHAGQAAAQATPTSPAQVYPNRSIRIVLPWPAGGITDVIMRAVNIHLAEAFGQQLVIDNRPGAGG
ncbi:MAG TPA: ABC transporter substrate-binding protein, partial [Burkholderiales bacterium]|nr:ABC transporter substrate-binding protein [Burkholderiales bacterium]